MSIFLKKSSLKLLNDKFPFTKKTLLPTLEVNHPIEDAQFNFDPFKFGSTFGMHRIREYYGE